LLQILRKFKVFPGEKSVSLKKEKAFTLRLQSYHDNSGPAYLTSDQQQFLTLIIQINEIMTITNY